MDDGPDGPVLPPHEIVWVAIQVLARHRGPGQCMQCALAGRDCDMFGWALTLYPPTSRPAPAGETSRPAEVPGRLSAGLLRWVPDKPGGAVLLHFVETREEEAMPWKVDGSKGGPAASGGYDYPERELTPEEVKERLAFTTLQVHRLTASGICLTCEARGCEPGARARAFLVERGLIQSDPPTPTDGTDG